MLKQEKKIGSSLLIEYFFTKNEFAIIGQIDTNYLSENSNDTVYYIPVFL